MYVYIAYGHRSKKLRSPRCTAFTVDMCISPHSPSARLAHSTCLLQGAPSTIVDEGPSPNGPTDLLNALAVFPCPPTSPPTLKSTPTRILLQHILTRRPSPSNPQTVAGPPESRDEGEEEHPGGKGGRLRREATTRLEERLAETLEPAATILTPTLHGRQPTSDDREVACSGHPERQGPRCGAVEVKNGRRTESILLCRYLS